VHYEIKLKPIGFVRVNFSDEEIKKSVKGVSGVIEVLEEYSEGLDGVEGFSHIIVIAYLHKVRDDQRKVLKVRPRKWAKLGVDISDIPRIGVFCTDSPHRPNPIALTIVKLIKREKNRLFVDGLDLFDGTPVIDIKGYTESRIIKNLKEPEWHKKLSKRIREKFGVETEA